MRVAHHKDSFGWVAERSIATVLHTSQQDKHQRSRARTSGEQHRQVRSANKTVGLKDRRKNSFGWVAERSIATVLKTVVGATPPGVRIPPHPPVINKSPQNSCGVYFCPAFRDFFNLVLPLYILSFLKYPISRILTYFAKNCDASLY